MSAMMTTMPIAAPEAGATAAAAIECSVKIQLIARDLHVKTQTMFTSSLRVRANHHTKVTTAGVQQYHHHPKGSVSLDFWLL
jgi:hypothetical protein